MSYSQSTDTRFTHSLLSYHTLMSRVCLITAKRPTPSLFLKKAQNRAHTLSLFNNNKHIYSSRFKSQPHHSLERETNTTKYKYKYKKNNSLSSFPSPFLSLHISTVLVITRCEPGERNTKTLHFPYSLQKISVAAIDLEQESLFTSTFGSCYCIWK